MKSMYIGSGDVGVLLSGLKTKGYQSLLSRFCSGETPHYNAIASPIDACRTGAILETRYINTLTDNYFPQWKEVYQDMDVFKASIDFARIEKGNIVDFDELKTVWFEEFFKIKPTIEFLKKKHKKYYNQIQEQLMCSGLESCNVVYLAVYSYDDTVNYNRDILDDDLIKVRVFRDMDVIEEIKRRGLIFQQIKDHLYEANS